MGSKSHVYAFLQAFSCNKFSINILKAGFICCPFNCLKPVLLHACPAGQLWALSHIGSPTLYLTEFELASDVSSLLSNNKQSGSQQLFHFWVKSSSTLVPLKCVLCML